MRQIIILLFMLIVVSSCSQDDTSIFATVTDENDAVSVELITIEKYIKKNHTTETRSDRVIISPYIFAGDTVMYIVNYGVDGGWEVFSNNMSLPMVLFKSEKGNFYLSEALNNPAFKALFDKVATNISLSSDDVDIVDDINPEWKIYNKDLIRLSNIHLDSYNNDKEYRWVASSVPTIKGDTLEPKGGRLITKWHQAEYFNLYTPYYEDLTNIHSLVGCVPIAIGQFLYHANRYFGKPDSTVTSATYNSSDNTYSFSGSSSTVWNSFHTIYDNRSDETFMKPTAVFLGYIGKSIGVKYGKKYFYGYDSNGEIVREGTGISLLDNKCVNFVMQQIGKSVEIRNVSQSNVKAILGEGYPVLMRSGIKDHAVGHAYIIDYYSYKYTHYYDYYAYVNVSNGDETDKEESPDIPEDVTLEELQAIFGEIYIESMNISQAWYKMNWGWGGKNDEVYVNADSSQWWIDGDAFTKNDAYMYYIGN